VEGSRTDEARPVCTGVTACEEGVWEGDRAVVIFRFGDVFFGCENGVEKLVTADVEVGVMRYVCCCMSKRNVIELGGLVSVI